MELSVNFLAKLKGKSPGKIGWSRKYTDLLKPEEVSETCSVNSRNARETGGES